MIRFETPRRTCARRATVFATLTAALWATSCAKKQPKPVHTEPWLAHPPASAAASASGPDAAIPTTRYVLTEQSVIHVELTTKLGKVHGKLTKVSGELNVALGALSRSRGEVRADLGSLALDDGSDANAETWLARAKSALGLADAGAAGAESTNVATFDVTALDDVSPEVLEPARASDGGAGSTKTRSARARATAEGNLLLHSFRVAKREPLEAEFGFTGETNAPNAPATIVIRSRIPLVISLDTHEIHLREPTLASASRATDQRRNRPAPTPHDVRISVELYARKDGGS